MHHERISIYPFPAELNQTNAHRLIAKGADANWINPWGPPGRALQFTCLHIASNNNHIAVVKHLCEKGKVNMDKKCPVCAPPALPLCGAAVDNK